MKQLKCPTCNSTLVIETDTPSNMDMETAKIQSAESTVKSNLKHSESISSIGKCLCACSMQDDLNKNGVNL